METKVQKLIDNPSLRGQTYKILKSMIITREILPDNVDGVLQYSS